METAEHLNSIVNRPSSIVNPAVRVRFAPSPTGYLHIGGARTALFNWIYARHKQGVFVLRIEDTDVARSSAEMIEGILEGLTWLGLTWDEGPFLQSERVLRYREMAQRLMEQERAYRCFCSAEELEERRRSRPPGGPPWKYDRRCHGLARQVIDRFVEQGQAHALRFLVPPGKTKIHDHVFGDVIVENQSIEDFVLLRSDRMPTYHLSVVTDDIDMRISHVIRGADHLPNTSKQILLYQALGSPLPEFAHLPLILGPDKKRLSKRHGATSVTAYRDMGIVPAAMVNFLSLLGWSPGGDLEILPLEEIITRFELDAINKSNAVFDLQKLEWMNSRYISEMPVSRLTDLVKPLLAERGLWKDEFDNARRAWLIQAVGLLRPRSKTLKELVDAGTAFFTDSFDYDLQARQKYLSRGGVKAALDRLRNEYESLEPFDLAATEKVLRSIAERADLKAGDLIGAVRVALTGRGVAPGLFEVMMVLGRERTVARLRRAVESLDER